MLSIRTQDRIELHSSMCQDDNPECEEDDELSAMTWELATRGKSGREIAQLHESWAAALLARSDFDGAQVRNS